ncbi:MAG: tetratricopeptide repeat protein [Gemmatimonadaceae bacterium]|nr:tetratricopeptide repeat protein [Gemmatimonadaceae bacterium]
MMRTAGRNIGRSLAAGALAWMAMGCFASVAQVSEVRDELNAVRAESAASDSVRTIQLVEVLSTLRAINDSISLISGRLSRVRADAQGDVRALRQEVSQVQAMSGQAEQRLQEMRAQIELRNRQAAVRAAATEPPLAGDTVPVMPTPASPVPDEPGPNELLQLGRDQLSRGGNRAARAAFADLLAKYPDSELAPDAQFYIAEAHAAEGTRVAADSAYALVVSKYGESSRAPTALYKRGVLSQTSGRVTVAKRHFNELVRKYPASAEAELARERLRLMT